MVESINVCNTSHKDSLTPDPSRDDVQGLETIQDYNILGGDNGVDWQDNNQDHLNDVAHSCNDLLSPSWLVQAMHPLGTTPPPCGSQVNPQNPYNLIPMPKCPVEDWAVEMLEHHKEKEDQEAKSPGSF